MNDLPLITDKISFSAFQKDETLRLVKFKPNGYIILFGNHGYHWKYLIPIRTDKKLLALRGAYYLLYGHTSDDDKDYVSIASGEVGKKIPIGSYNFGFAFNPRQFESLEWFNTCIKVPLPTEAGTLTSKEALSLLNTYREGRKLRVHSYEGGAGILMGCAIDLKSIVEYFKDAKEIGLSGKHMRSLGHGVVFLHPLYNRYTFLQTDRDKIDAIWKERENKFGGEQK